MRFVIVTFGFTFCLIHSLFGQPATPISAAQIRQLDSIATQDVPARSPGIATGIVKDGRIVYQTYAGYANLADSVLIGEQSRFNIASNAKQFTALAILLLADGKRLRLDDDIRTFFPHLYAGIRPNILIRHLLNHTSGIRDVYDLWSLQGITWWKTTLTNPDAMALLQAQKELNFKPGTAYLYSNSNYILLAQIIEKVTGESFVNYTKRLFVQLGMPNTAFVDNHKSLPGPVAQPYFNFDRWVNYPWLCDLHGDGNLFTTLPDQLQWETIVQQGHHEALPPGLIRRSQQLVESSGIAPYGFGLEFGTYRGTPYQFHEGATGAWKATFLRFSADRLSFVTLTNSGKTIPAAQTRQMADVLLGTQSPKSADPVQPERPGPYVSIPEVTGTYFSQPDLSFQFEQRDSSLYLFRLGRNTIQLVRESANCFHQSNDPNFKLAFIKDPTGKLRVTAYHPTHAPYTLDRSEQDWRGFEFERINGTYQNEEIHQSLTIRHQSGQQFTAQVGDSERACLLVTPTKLLCEGFQLTIPQNPGPATVFLDSDRIHNVRFRMITRSVSKPDRP